MDIEATPKSASFLLLPVKCSLRMVPREPRKFLRSRFCVTIRFIAFFSMTHSCMWYLLVQLFNLSKRSSGFWL